MTVVIPFLCLALMLVINAPVALALAFSALSFFLLADGLPVEILIQRLISATESFPLLAIPFFVLAGNMMNAAGITGRVMSLAETLVGHQRGGLARVNVLLSTMMGGMSGSANADAAMQSTILVPEMVKHGYNKAFSAAITAFSSVITAIIPPSIGLILYGFLADVSIGRLFLAGIIPGLFMCITLLIAVAWISKKEGFVPTREVKAGWPERGHAFADAIWALMIPVGILGGIRIGLYTPTEAGAIAVLYSLLIGRFIYRTLDLRELPKIFVDSAVSTATIMLIICAAQAFSFFLAWERLPVALSDFLISSAQSKIAFLLLVNALLIAVGMLLEGGAALIILTPLLVPVAISLGIDPVHFGIVVVLNLTLAGVTPPVGTLMYTTCSITKVPVGEFARKAVPLYVVSFIALLVITNFESLSVALPNLVYGD